MQVFVTEEMIKQGIPCDGNKCPIHQALAPHIPNGYKFLVENTTLHVISDAYKTYRTIPLPPKARKFIHLFDLGKTVVPFSFEIELELPSSLDDGHQFDSSDEFDSEDMYEFSELMI